MICFDDLNVNDRFVTPARTVTESDIGMFAGLTGDFNDNHMNDEASKKKFGGRIAHGMLIVTLTRGLMFRAGLVGQTPETAFLGISEISFKNPVKIGDTIHVECIVKGLTEDQKEASCGTVLFGCNVINQNDVVVQHDIFQVLLRKKEVKQ